MLFFVNLILYVLDNNVLYTNQVRAVCLWNSSDSIEPLIDKRGLLAGWGTDQEEVREKLHTPESRHVNIPIVSHFECLKADPAFRNITSENTFCAGMNTWAVATLEFTKLYIAFIFR